MPEAGHPPVLIIGAGPAGLAVAGQLRERGIDFELLERDRHVGASWRTHYERLHLHTVKELSSLPGRPFPEAYPRYVPRQGLVDYYEDFARHYRLSPRFGHEVERIERRDGRWHVHATNGAVFAAPHVVLATGANRAPYRPHFTDEEDFSGQVLHSSEYCNAVPFTGKRVAVIGMGNSGAEIALDLSKNGVTTFISVRGPVNIVPLEVFGRPTQLSALQLARLPHWLGDRLGLLLRRLTVGDLRRYGLELSPDPPARQLRLTGKTPVIDLGTIAQIKAGKIRVLPGVDHFTPTGIVFENGEEVELDAVILATGFRAQLERLIPDIAPDLDPAGLPRDVIGAGRLGGLYFVGFDNYVAGGILGVIRRDAPRVAEVIRERLASSGDPACRTGDSR